MRYFVCIPPPINLPQGAQIHQKPHPISTNWYFCKITLFFLFNEIIIVFLQKIKKNEKK